jgi:DNA-binding NtrC family response regulator
VADLIVVDDDVDVGDMLADVLRDDGHTVRVARDGASGLELLEERLPDAVLLDVEMPKLDGPQMVMQMFLRDCGRERVPIILQSGAKNLAAIAKHVSTPYFICKPFTIQNLRETVARALLEQIAPRPTA